MRHVLHLIAILALAGCAMVEYGGPEKRTKTSLPPNLLARLPLLNVGDPHGDRYLTPLYDGRIRQGDGGDMNVEVHYYFHGTEDRMIGFRLFFPDAKFTACVKAISEQFGNPTETKTEALSAYPNTINHIVIWHRPDGDLTAVEYLETIRGPATGQIVFETKELAGIRAEWERERGIIAPELYSQRIWF